MSKVAGLVLVTVVLNLACHIYRGALRTLLGEGRGGQASYTCYMQKEGGGIRIACKNAYVINARPETVYCLALWYGSDGWNVFKWSKSPCSPFNITSYNANIYWPYMYPQYTRFHLNGAVLCSYVLCRF